jgi:hypothetical protein
MVELAPYGLIGLTAVLVLAFFLPAVLSFHRFERSPRAT